MKIIKRILIILLIIIVLGLVFFVVDYNRVKKQEKPIFCINILTYRDGGTKVYYGLGYKVIAFNRIEGYNEVKIGTWNMKYEDFELEYKVDNIKKVEITGFEIEKNITLNNGNAKDIIDILENLDYNQDLCDGITKYTIKIEDDTTYYVKSDCNGVVKDGKQAEISDVALELLEDIINTNKN